MTKLRVTQIRSVIHRPKDQKATVRRLGLHRLGDSVVKDDRPEIRGMIAKVSHLVKVEEMKLHHLRPASGATRRKRRVGRGRAAGQGKTAGRGTKGYGARHNPKLGFEGGQMPLQRRVPKLKGFTNRNRVEYSVVNVETLAMAFERGEVDPAAMLSRGLIHGGRPVKVLARGDIGRALTVKAHAFSEAAKAKIEAAGGTTELVT